MPSNPLRRPRGPDVPAAQYHGVPGRGNHPAQAAGARLRIRPGGG
ncbi:MAG: hypothetical protein AVDCRST_MAG27-774 [uncultured Craurococcus sp.]|uniref:Uncharacterized protein n=1 Tax=uncultured Craurococcus sp. TaxID=1135998 RepID=A0A6J4HKB3_9PROT|nr:MAG: hypothetical protein AVDCRST_MAG27-774 [uncultured Craurococcus sp.]